MATEHDELPVEIQVEIVKFSEINVRWLVKVLSLPNKTWTSAEATEDQALAIFAAIQGAQLVARGRNDVSAYHRIVNAYWTAGLLS